MLHIATDLSFQENSESLPLLITASHMEATARIPVVGSPGAPSSKTGMGCVQPEEEGYSCFYSPLRCSSKVTKHIYHRQLYAWFINQNSELLECQELKPHWAIRHSQNWFTKGAFEKVLVRICLCCVLAQKSFPSHSALAWLLLILRPQHKCHLVRKPLPDHPDWARSPNQCSLSASCSSPSQHWSRWIITRWLVCLLAFYLPLQVTRSSGIACAFSLHTQHTAPGTGTQRTVDFVEGVNEFYRNQNFVICFLPLSSVFVLNFEQIIIIIKTLSVYDHPCL